MKKRTNWKQLYETSESVVRRQKEVIKILETDKTYLEERIKNNESSMQKLKKELKHQLTNELEIRERLEKELLDWKLLVCNFITETKNSELRQKLLNEKNEIEVRLRNIEDRKFDSYGKKYNISKEFLKF